MSRFIVVGEEISEGEDKELQEIHSCMNNSNELEDQPVGSDIKEEEKTTDGNKRATGVENLMSYTTTVSGQVSKPPACLFHEFV